MLWLGLTGGVATGKSSFARILRSHGVPVADADQIARDSLSQQSPVYQKVVQAFGVNIIDKKGEIDRIRLGEIVFQNENLKNQLESWVHPLVQSQVQRLRSEWQNLGHPMAVYDVPLLFEKNLITQFDAVVVVSCTKEQQAQRWHARTGLSVAVLQQRMGHQIPLDVKVRLADFVVDNSKNVEHLEQEAIRFFQWTKVLKPKVFA